MVNSSTMSIKNVSFQTAQEMSYASNDQTKIKAEDLISKLKKHLKTIKKDKSLFLTKDEVVYVPDIHGDFVHLIITLHRHGLLNNNLDLKKDYSYVFLGDFYDRAPDSDVIDYWINNQIKNDLKIYRLIGNHEIAFFERESDGSPIVFPSQDSIKDIRNGFQVTENLLKNIAEGSILAAYVDCRRGFLQEAPTVLYVHSYIINDDFIELGLEINSDIVNFAHALNNRLKLHGQYAYDLFIEQKKEGKYNWKEIMKSFNNDPLFNIYDKKNDISTSFIWRRTSLPILNTYPAELEVGIPENVYQIVGHTPVFLFSLPQGNPINKPFVISAKNGTGKIQFSDVGIGYYYKSDFERPEVIIKKVF